MNEFYIPTNFEDSGKLMGMFELRNVVEAALLSLPFIYVIFVFLSVGLTWKIILSAVFAVPIAGFSIIGVNDDPLTVFASTWWKWFKSRKIIEYRGETK